MYAGETISSNSSWCYEIWNGWRWNKDKPLLEEQGRACSISLSGMRCLCSQLAFFSPLQIFYPFKANSLSSGWEVLSKEVSTKAEQANQPLSPLSRQFGLREQMWATSGRWEFSGTPVMRDLGGYKNPYSQALTSLLSLWLALHFFLVFSS